MLTFCALIGVDLNRKNNWERFFTDRALSLLSNQKLAILIYHRVHAEKDLENPGKVDSGVFNWQMELVSRYFNVLPLSSAIELLQENQLPPRSLSVTFDDGYADNVEVALPIIQKYGLTATFFISTGYLDGGRMWNDTVAEVIRSMPNGLFDLSELDLGVYQLETPADRNQCIQSVITRIKHFAQDHRTNLTEQLRARSKSKLSDGLMMTSSQVKELSDAGMEIGGHTVTHPILATIDREQAKKEIVDGKEHLERIISKPVRLFAYPNGKPGQDYLSEHVELVRDLGFIAAVSTEIGVSKSSTDRFQLKRFTPWDRNPRRFMLRLIANYFSR